jgi:transposase
MEKDYPRAAVERAMKVQEIILRAIGKRITWMQAAEILRISDRSMRRWRERYEKYGYDGLFDRRLGKPSPKQVPLETVEKVLTLYREKYFDFNVLHFHEKLVEEHGIDLSYTWVKTALQGAGLVKKAKKRGQHRKRRERRPMAGMMLHIDASKHQWFGDGRWHDLITVMDDATSDIYYAQFVDEESTATVMAALRDVVERKGIFCSLYSDRASHFWHTAVAGQVVDRQELTQVGRALSDLGIEMIPAYSPQARGRCERSYKTWQGRLPQELRLAGVNSVEEANRFLREQYIAEYNRRFAVVAKVPGNAFLPVRGRDLDLIFSLQWERAVARDNTVRFANRVLQINKTKWWNTLAGCRVKVFQHFDETLTIRYGGHIVGRFSAEGEPLEDAKAKKSAKPPAQKKRAMETAAMWEHVEKPNNGFTTSSHNAWKTRSKKRSEFPTVPTARAASSIK